MDWRELDTENVVVSAMVPARDFESNALEFSVVPLR